MVFPTDHETPKVVEPGKEPLYPPTFAVPPQSGSPALRRRRHCYFHNRMLDGKTRYKADGVRPRPLYSMCLLEDANSVQVAIMQVLEILSSGQMDYKMAGLMLYGLQTASGNLRNVRFEAEKRTDVVIDRQALGQTCLDGPQWFASDFEERGKKRGRKKTKKKMRTTQSQPGNCP